MRVSLIATFLLATVLDANAADVWIKVQTPHFKIVGNSSEAQMRTVAAGLEDFLPEIVRIFPSADLRSTAAMTMVVFKDDASYAPFKPDRETAPANLVGYFLDGYEANFITASGG